MIFRDFSQARHSSFKQYPSRETERLDTKKIIHFDALIWLSICSSQSPSYKKSLSKKKEKPFNSSFNLICIFFTTSSKTLCPYEMNTFFSLLPIVPILFFSVSLFQSAGTAFRSCPPLHLPYKSQNRRFFRTAARAARTIL